MLGTGDKDQNIFLVINHDITASFLYVPCNWVLSHDQARTSEVQTSCMCDLYSSSVCGAGGKEGSLTFPCSFSLCYWSADEQPAVPTDGWTKDGKNLALCYHETDTSVLDCLYLAFFVRKTQTKSKLLSV